MLENWRVFVVEKNESFKIMKNTKILVFEVVEFSKNFPKSEMVLKKNCKRNYLI